MVSIPEIDIPTAIAAVVLAFLLNLLNEYGVKNYFKEKRGKREWYQQLIELSKEIKFNVTTRRDTLDYWDSRNPLEMDIEEFLEESQLETIREAIDGLEMEGEDEFIQAIMSVKWLEKKRETQEEIMVDMKIYEERLRQHLAQYPEDIDEETIQIAASLLRKLNAAGTVGQLNKEFEEDIWDTADALISKCRSAIEDI